MSTYLCYCSTLIAIVPFSDVAAEPVAAKFRVGQGELFDVG